MICPTCEEGSVNKIRFKKSNNTGFLCDFCGTAWLENEYIEINSGHSIRSTNRDDMEYTIEDEEDMDKKSVLFPKYK